MNPADYEARSLVKPLDAQTPQKTTPPCGVATSEVHCFQLIGYLSRVRLTMTHTDSYR